MEDPAADQGPGMRAASTTLEGLDSALCALAVAIEARDGHSPFHITRVAAGALALGEAINLDESLMGQLKLGALLHDLGKLGVPEAILRKPGLLGAIELESMRRHPVMGEAIAALPHPGEPFLAAVRHHHEHYDGSGYPDNLVGEAIPLLARIVAVSDAYDALISDRPFRSARSQGEAIATLRWGAGTQWDRYLVEVFTDAVLPTGRLEAISALLPFSL